MAYVHIENGPRHAVQEDFKGYRIRVVTGYNAVADNWPVHAYRLKLGAQGQELGKFVKMGVGGFANYTAEAFEQGMAAAKLEIVELFG